MKSVAPTRGLIMCKKDELQGEVDLKATMENAPDTRPTGASHFEEALREMVIDDMPVSDETLKATLMSRAEKDFASKSQLREGESYDLEQSRVVRRKDGSFRVSADIKGAAQGSAISGFFDSTMTIQTTVQVSLHEVGEASGTVELYVDGVKTFEKTVDYSVQPVALDWGGLNRCLASMGIPGWSAGALGTACGVACAVRFGPGCAVCIGAAAGISGGTAAYCIQHSNEY